MTEQEIRKQYGFKADFFLSLRTQELQEIIKEVERMEKNALTERPWHTYNNALKEFIGILSSKLEK